MATYECNAYTDFLGLSAAKLKSDSYNYQKDICVYALSAKRNISVEPKDILRSNIRYITDTNLTAFKWTATDVTSNIKFAKSSDNTYMCYKFKLSDINTESDDEPDIPYSYEELFNQSVIKHLDKSTNMQYGYIWSAYINASGYNNRMKNNFYVTNSIESPSKFARSDYYRFYVPETDIIHNRSMLELQDDTFASIGNSAYEPFNCLLFCVNPKFDAAVNKGKSNMPQGFDNGGASFSAVPISICTYSQDIIYAGTNILFEPNLNGIVTAE